MEDRFVKYSKLYALIFLLFLSVPVLLGLVVVLFYGISRLISSSYVDIAFGLCVISMTPALFSTAYLIFLKRTKTHPARWVRSLSILLFIVGISVSGLVLVVDMISFFRQFKTDIAAYRSFSLVYTAGNVGALFLIAIIQALTTSKEVDWMDRNK